MLLGFVIMTAFVPNIVGATVPTGWAVMWLSVSAILVVQWWRKIDFEMTDIHWLGLAFLSYASLSLLWSPHGAYDLLQWFAIASVFVWSYTLKDIKPVVIGLAFGLAVSSILAVFQYFGYDFGIFRFTSKPAGLFINSNLFAEASGMLLVLLIVYKLWWLIPVTLPGLLVSSRAVILGLSAALLVWVWRKSKIVSLCILGIVVAKIGTSINASANDHLGLLLDTLSGLTLSGHGIGSFEYLYPVYAKHIDLNTIRYFEAHNDWLQLLFELGVGTIPLMMIIFKLLKVDDVRQYALVFFIVTGTFAFPLHLPITAFVVALVAGQLARASMVHRDFSYNSRSTLFNRLAT